MLKKTITLMVLFILLIQTAALAAPIDRVAAQTAVLIVLPSRKVLFDRQAHRLMYPASTTKIMTLLVALERGNLNSIVTVSSKAAGCEGSSLGLKSGDQLSLRELLTGMMMVSGNDAAIAVAEHLAGSVSGFVAMMNKRAEVMGLEDTHFANPHGLPDPYNHYSSAYDLAQIAAVGMQRVDFVQIVSKQEHHVIFLNRAPLFITTTNKFLKSYIGANGIKTGYTEAAGDCLVGGAKRRGVQLIGVVLNDDNRWEDMPVLLDYGFEKTNVD